jgi:hypothetical protein
LNCGGTGAQLTSLTCVIPVATLQAPPYNLAWGSSIYAKIAAVNGVGTSATSSASNGGIILTTPDAPLTLT